MFRYSKTIVTERINLLQKHRQRRAIRQSITKRNTITRKKTKEIGILMMENRIPPIAVDTNPYLLNQAVRYATRPKNNVFTLRKQNRVKVTSRKVYRTK